MDTIELLQAIVNANHKFLNDFYRQCPELIDRPILSNYNALSLSQQFKNWSVMEQLLKLGANPNLLNSSGSSLLQQVCREGHHHATQLLIHFRADYNALDKDNNSALTFAIMHRHRTLVQELLSLPDIHLGSQDMQKSVVADDTFITQLLLEKAAQSHDEALWETYFASALANALNRKNYALTQIILEIKSAYDQGRTLNTSQKSCDYSEHAAKKLLEQFGTLLVPQTLEQKTPLMCALLRDDLLLAHELSSSLNLEQEDALGNTILLLSSAWSQSAFVHYLLTNKLCNIKHQNQAGQTALHQAVLANNRSILSLLLQYGLDPNLSDKQGVTPLIYAIKNRNTQLVRTLLAAGAHPNVKDSTGRNALSLSISLEDINTRTALISAGAAMSDPLSTSKPVIITAIETDNYNLVLRLLNHRAPLSKGPQLTDALNQASPPLKRLVEAEYNLNKLGLYTHRLYLEAEHRLTELHKDPQLTFEDKLEVLLRDIHKICSSALETELRDRIINPLRYHNQANQMKRPSPLALSERLQSEPSGVSNSPQNLSVKSSTSTSSYVRPPVSHIQSPPLLSLYTKANKRAVPEADFIPNTIELKHRKSSANFTFALT